MFIEVHAFNWARISLLSKANSTHLNDIQAYILDGIPIANGARSSWEPTPGKSSLLLADNSGMSTYLALEGGPWKVLIDALTLKLLINLVTNLIPPRLLKYHIYTLMVWLSWGHNKNFPNLPLLKIPQGERNFSWSKSPMNSSGPCALLLSSSPRVWNAFLPLTPYPTPTSPCLITWVKASSLNPYRS